MPQKTPASLQGLFIPVDLSKPLINIEKIWMVYIKKKSHKLWIKPLCCDI